MQVDAKQQQQPLSSPSSHAPAALGRKHAFPAKVGDFELLACESLEFAPVTVAKWHSTKTGLKVVYADVESPLVQAYMPIVTEIFDDTGRPHTLEHLIFMGSEKYPYKGILDTFANRSFAQGTNAWTDITNTTYTIGTAGQEGFLRILPVYLDHILYPTQTAEAFTTEVYHMNGAGEDSGVVYSEMQGRENGSADLMQLRLQRMLYTKQNALRSETGGLMEALRELTVESIRQYHASRYLPQNMTIIVTGRSLDPKALLETLSETVELSLAEHGQANGPRPEGWVRPFVESSTASNPPLLPKNVTEVVEFPEKDESVGELMISWIGVPRADFLGDLALECLGEYLTQSATSPLFKEFVEIDEPKATYISFSSSTEDPVIITCYLSAVPAEFLGSLPDEFAAALARIAKEGVELGRMHDILGRQKMQLLEKVEDDAAEVLSTTILADVIYGKEDGSELHPSMKTMTDYETLERWSSEQWSTLLQDWLVEKPSVTVVGKPSAALADKIEAEEKARVAANVERLGPDGLAKLAKKLEEAQKANDRPIPPGLIENFKVPDVNKIDWINVDSARARGVSKAGSPELASKVQSHIDSDPAELPLFTQFDQISSNFVEITLVLFLDDAKLAPLTPLYIDSFFSLPVTRADGTKLDFEQVVTALDAETLSYSIDTNSPLQEGFSLRIKVAKDKYPTAVAWLSDLLYGSSFSVDRLKIAATKALQNIPSEKRDGDTVAHAAYRSLVGDADKSTALGLNLLQRAEFLPTIKDQLKAEPDKVVARMEAFRKAVTNPKAMRVQVKGDILALASPASTFVEHFKPTSIFEPSELLPVQLSREALSSLGSKPSKKMIVYGVPSIESSFGYHVAKGPSDPLDPDQAALTTARAVLNAMESFLWRYIRGAGLAYGANINQDVESGLIHYSVYKSPDSSLAFKAAKKLIDDLVAREIEIDQVTLESAKSGLAFTTANREATVTDAANASFTDTLLNRPPGHGRKALARTKDITVEQVLAAIEKYIQPIFNPDSSIGSVACGLAKLDTIATEFEKLGYEVERRTIGGQDESDEEGSQSGSESGSESD